MAKIQKHIEIVRSSVVGLSSLSQASAESIQAALAKHYSYVHVSRINTLAELAELKRIQPDLVFLGMKFLPHTERLGKTDANKLWIADYLDEHGICYTGSNGDAAQFDQDKSLAKRRMQETGLDTADFIITNPRNLPSAAAISIAYPVFIKPPRMGGGQGVDEHSVAHTYAELRTKVASIAEQHGAESLVEEYLTGREFSVAVLAHEATGALQAMPIELVSPMNGRGDRMLSNAVKTGNLETASVIHDEALKASICRLAINAFRALGGRDYGRIDIRLNSHGKPQFLEANLIPSLIDGYGSFPKACQLNADLGYEDMLLEIVRLGFAHPLVRPTTAEPRHRVSLTRLELAA